MNLTINILRIDNMKSKTKDVNKLIPNVYIFDTTICLLFKKSSQAHVYSSRNFFFISTITYMLNSEYQIKTSVL